MDLSILRDKKVVKKDWLVQSTYWRDVVGLLAMMDLGCFDCGCFDCGCVGRGSWVVGRGSWVVV